MIFIIVGIFFGLYFIGIACYTGLNSKFPLIWLVIGIVNLIFGIALKNGWVAPTLFPKMAQSAVGAVTAVAVIIYVVIQILIFSQFNMKVKKELPYLIVLGAQMKSRGPSKILRRRLERAYEYLIENKKTVVIVSGGQGSNEPMSEAEGMKCYLVDKGIEPKRILKEDLSVNTHQNLVFSKNLYLQEVTEIGVVSSNFHMFRAKKIALKAGFQKVYGIPAYSEPFMLLNHTSREVCGIIKDYLAGNL